MCSLHFTWALLLFLDSADLYVVKRLEVRKVFSCTILLRVYVYKGKEWLHLPALRQVYMCDSNIPSNYWISVMTQIEAKIF